MKAYNIYRIWKNLLCTLKTTANLRKHPYIRHHHETSELSSSRAVENTHEREKLKSHKEPSQKESLALHEIRFAEVSNEVRAHHLKTEFLFQCF